MLCWGKGSGELHFGRYLCLHLSIVGDEVCCVPLVIPPPTRGYHSLSPHNSRTLLFGLLTVCGG